MPRAEGLPIKMIARICASRGTLCERRWRLEGPPKYVRKPAGSAVDEFEQLIREELRAVPTMPATVIAERVG